MLSLALIHVRAYECCNCRPHDASKEEKIERERDGQKRSGQ